MQGQSTCEYCGETYERNPLARKPQIYCGQKCNDNASYHRRRKRLLEMTTGQPCECGCGELAAPGSRFIYGHRVRVYYPHGPAQTPLADRVWPKIDRSGGPDACWPWLANRDAHGYGMLGRGGRGAGNMRATHAVWMLTRGLMQEGLWALHRCDNPPCCNPAHLFLGTAKDNTADMWAKGRANPTGAKGEHSPARKYPEKYRGELNGRAVLTEAQVREIRQRYATRGVSQETLGRDYGVSQVMISLIIRRVSWPLVD